MKTIETIGAQSLWLLKRVPGFFVGWDEYTGHVVRARTEAGARALTAASADSQDPGPRGKEGAATWLDPIRSSCERLYLDGEPGVILSAFSAG